MKCSDCKKLDFIINYDIKYRTRQDAEEEEENS